MKTWTQQAAGLLTMCAICLPLQAQKPTTKEAHSKSRSYTEISTQTDLTKNQRVFKSSDGYRLVLKTGQAPQNRELRVYNAKSQIKLWAGLASEMGTYSFVATLPLKKEFPHEGFYATTNIDLLTEQMTQPDQYTRCALPASEMAVMKLAFDTPINSSIFDRFCLKRNSAGNIIEVYDSIKGKSIKAPEQGNIRFELKPNSAFWTNDLEGGHVLLNFYVHPVNTQFKAWTQQKYCFYQLQMEQQYNANQDLECVKLYSPDTQKLLLTKKRVPQADGTVAYETTYPNRKDLVRQVWKNGRLQLRETISSYGTVVLQTVLSPTQDGKSYIMYDKKYDYNQKKLVRVSEKRVDRAAFEKVWQESQEMSMQRELEATWNGKF